MEKLKEELALQLPSLMESGLLYTSDIFERYVDYLTISYYIGLGFGILLFIAGLIMCITNDDWEYPNTRGIFGVLFLFIALIILPVTSLSLIKLNTVPEVLVIQSIIN